MNYLNDMPKATGEVYIERFTNGELVETRLIPNLVVSIGRQFIASRMVDTDIPDQMTHMALGGSNTAASLLDTSLGAELGRVGLAGGEGAVATNTVSYSASFPAGVATGEVVEAGIFNDVSAGTMMCRTVFPLITKGSEDSLAVTWVITIN